MATLPSPPTSISASAPALSPLVRETALVQVDGVTETWSLRWLRPPMDYCLDAGWSTAPCLGFSYGERGALVLSRTRPGAAEELFSLDRLFEDGESILPHWPTDPNDSFDMVDIASVKRRPPVEIMKLADFDHDGHATEFVLQVATGAYGHRPSIVLGLDAHDRHLHAFADDHGEALVLDRPALWDAVRDAKSSPISVLEVACGDHGAEEEHSAVVSFGSALRVVRKTKKCP